MVKSGTITLKDVAREAGVAKGTASFVLNGSKSGTQVSESTRARIVDVANRLGYRPNGVARGLTRRRMDIIGMAAAVYGGVNLYFMEMFNGALDEAARFGQSVNVLPIPGGWSQSGQSRLLAHCDERIDGLILIAPDHLEPGFLTALRESTPLVTIHAGGPEPTVPDLEANDESGLYAATAHLIALGHRRIAHLPGEMDSHGGKRRLKGYQRALLDHGIDYDPDLVIFPGNFAEESGKDRTAELLDSAHAWSPERRPTAISCVNDATAFGCLNLLRERGIRVPEEMSVTGFDDVLSAQVGETPLTTVHQPLMEMGARAVQLLMEQIEARLQGTAISQPATEVFEAALVVRATTTVPAYPSTR